MKYVPVILLILSISNCSKTTIEDPTNVQNYIQLLQSNQYDSLNLPAFTSQDIPALLAYRNDRKIIHKFPVNPISSFYVDECRLGIYILWTVESIRAVENQSDQLITRFPSLNPILVSKLDPSSGDEKEAHGKAAQAYFDWWEQNQNKSFKALSKIDPLQDTDYQWR